MASYTLATKDGLATTQYTSAVRNQIAKRTLTGLLSYSINFRDVNLINNPYKNRYYNFGITTTMNGGDMIGDIADVYKNENHIITFLDDFGGLSKFTEDKQFMPKYSDHRNRYSLEEHEIYSVSTELGKNSYSDSMSVDDNVQDIANELLGIGRKKTYEPRKNANYAATYTLYDEEHIPTLDDKSHITFDDNIDNFGDDSEYAETSLLYKTNKLFREGKIHSLINRFSTGLLGDAAEEKRDLLHTAFSQYGFSRGRNLLKKDVETINSYDNPYCRVWTSHYQYSKMSDLIRPFMAKYGMFTSLYELQRQYGMLRPYYSNARLRDYSAIERGGIVRYTPDKELMFGNGWATENHGDIRNYMFSIENLAWKDAGDYYRSYLSKEQKGPFGGRIMWFPPYNLKFNDTANANWNPTQVLGRIEPIYTFGGSTTRSGSLSFSILVDHPSVINLFKEKKLNILEKDVEDALLRFFAGCDDLSEYLPANLTQEWMHYSAWTETSYKTKKKTEEVVNDDDTTGGDEGEPHEEAEKIKKRCVFYAFYPNNVSGYQDVNIKNGNDAKKTGAKDFFERKWYVPRPAGYEMKVTAKGSMGGISRKTMGRPKCKTWRNGDPTWGKQIEDVISYDYTQINGEPVSGGSLCDSVEEIWRQNWNTKFDLEDFGMNSSEMARAIMLITAGNTNSEEAADKEIMNKYGSYANDIVSKFGLTGDDFKDCVVYSLEDMKSLTLKDVLSDVAGEEVNEADVIKTIEVNVAYGSASQHGEDVKTADGRPMNTALGERRAESLVSYIAARGIIDDDELTEGLNQIKKKTNIKEVSTGNTKIDQSNFVAKVGRAAMVFIDFEVPETLKEDGENNPIPGAEYTTGYTVETVEQEKITEEKIKYFDWSEELDTVAFDNEFLYFDRIKNEQDSIIYKNIKDKIKFFDPAFHSITPEGFNARLTFLHQCLRCGPTKAASDSSNTSVVNNTTGSNESVSSYGAGNLAFGRPPVCVLRVGDFFFSKVLITSLNIEFDKGYWDMNPEGIGLQPMIANVSLGITFIGGQDITGPIAQLQNAVSSNFYANASIYDKSANTNDIGIYQRGGIKP
jgi:hypothetical protein